MATYCSHRPRAYAANKLPTMISRWNGPAGDAVRRYGARIWSPSIPPEALLSFSANSTGPEEVVTGSFQAIGLYNTPTGQYPGSAGAWYNIATGAEFEGFTGRRGVTGSGWSRAIEDQVVIGLIDYRDDIANVSSRIPSDLRPPMPPDTQWAWACGAFGYVTATGANLAINEHADALRAVREDFRFGALLAATAESGFTSQTAYPLVRAWQRLECGRALAEHTGGDVEWFDLGLGRFYDAVEHRITLAYYGAPDCALQPGAEGPVGTEIPTEAKNALLILLGLGLVVWGGKKVYDTLPAQRRRR